MKKLIFVLLVIAAIPMMAQNSDKYISVGQIPTEQKMINNITQRTLEALRVITLNDSSGSTNLYTKIDTSKITVDTLIFGFNSRDIYYLNEGSATDTLYISPLGNFPSSQTIKIVGGESGYVPLSWSRAYIKFDYTPISGKHYRFIAF